MTDTRRFAVWITVPALLALAAGARAAGPFDLGGRLEPFVDAALIESMDGAALKLQPPTRREIVFSFDKPWEGPVSAYCTVLYDGLAYRLYYRGHMVDDNNNRQLACMAVSSDGIHFARPNLGLYEFGGSWDNNIVWIGKEAHNFTPFLDANPAARPDERFKALGGNPPIAFKSADGVHWSKMQEEPVITEGAFDSQNLAFWDTEAGLYRSYSRSWSGGGYEGFRTIQSCASTDFIHWSPPAQNRYAENVPAEHFYTNATVPHPGAPHIFLSFPMRFVPNRKKIETREVGGVSDAVFMSSRDGAMWDRPFLEAWIRPGPGPRNWTDRNIMPAWGVHELTPGEYSVYHSEHYRWDSARLRRVTVRKDGFASLSAGAMPGTAVTKPFVFEGDTLWINYSTSAAGSIRFEFLVADGDPLPEWSGDNAAEIFGDSLREPVEWGNGGSLEPLEGQPVRLRITLKDADLYSIQFGVK